MSTHATELPAACCPQPTRKAFTLVEMLVVITIIGILAALGSVAVFKALEAAKRARIKAEITNLESALQQYKTQYKDFPPSDMSDTAAISRHLSTAFPRCDPTVEINYIPYTGAPSTGTSYNPAASGMNAAMTPSQAMVFWLTAFSKDATHPLSAKTADRNSLFDFDKTRLVPGGGTTAGWTLNGSGNPVCVAAYYVPQSGAGIGYAYFAAKSYLKHATDPVTTSPTSPVPYLQEPWDVGTAGLDAGTNGPPTNDVKSDTGSNWIASSFQKICANPNSFQLISAGLDGDYGTPSSTQTASAKVNGNNRNFKYKSFPSGLGYDPSGADDDNLTNFSEKSLGDAKP